MKVMVEWGRPKAFTNGRPCGISGRFLADNPTQGSMLASQLFFTMGMGKWNILDRKAAWSPTRTEPRKVRWAPDGSFWVCVSLLDGVMRGDYAGIAEQEWASVTTLGQEAPHGN